MKKIKDDHKIETNTEVEFKIFYRAQTAGVIAVVAVCLFFFIATALINSTFGFNYISIMFVYLSVVCFSSFAKFKNIYHLIIGSGFALVFICTLIMHFISIA
jgi:hypothetical protein